MQFNEVQITVQYRAVECSAIVWETLSARKVQLGRHFIVSFLTLRTRITTLSTVIFYLFSFNDFLFFILHVLSKTIYIFFCFSLFHFFSLSFFLPYFQFFPTIITSQMYPEPPFLYNVFFKLVDI